MAAVVKVHAALEAAGKQLAQQPTTGLFFIQDHVRTSLPAVMATATTMQHQQHMCQVVMTMSFLYVSMYCSQRLKDALLWHSAELHSS